MSTPRTDSLRVGIALYSDDAQRLADALEHAETLERDLSASRERAEKAERERDEMTSAATALTNKLTKAECRLNAAEAKLRLKQRDAERYRHFRDEMDMSAALRMIASGTDNYDAAIDRSETIRPHE